MSCRWMHNLATLSDDETARTDPECAAQRADHLAVLGVRSVLELCVGPSLRRLSDAYGQHGITVTGNDVDQRWQRYYPQGRWLIGDAFAVAWHGFDAVVFAPPLTWGCTGRRVDALRISQVQPSYATFIAQPFTGYRVMVLPARAHATAADRRELHALLASIDGPYDVVALTAGPRRTRKYVDVYFRTSMLQGGLPINPPIMGHVIRAELETRGVTFKDDIASDAGFWFWTYADRAWAVGPYRRRRTAMQARKRFLQLDDGPVIRTWSV